MRKSKKQKPNIPTGSLVYYGGFEEIVIRSDETQVSEIKRELRRKKSKRVLRNAVCFVSAFAFLLSGTVLGKRGIEKYMVYSQEKKAVEYTIPDDVADKLSDMTDEEAWANLYEKYPKLLNVKFPAGMNYEYALYYAKNPKMVGYLKIDGTNIDTPIAQAENNKYYLTHDFYDNYTSYGAIFAAYGHDMNNLDRNTLLYGHNMKDGSRFAGLIKYRSLDFFIEHPTITFNTLTDKHEWKIFAVFITNGDAKQNNGYFFDFTFNFCSDSCYAEYITELEKRRLYDTGVDLLPTDKILTLCTCSFEYNNARLVIVARMVRDGESAEVDTSKASYKTTPIKYPDAYYSSASKNHYKDDKKWYLY